MLTARAERAHRGWRERLSVVGPADGSRLAGLDGLRGIAVAFVVLDHSHVDGRLYSIFSIGGSAGVTTFFVLSGFLITSLLLREYDLRGRIDLLAFWGRRALRLLPALWLWMTVVTLVFWLAGWSQLWFFIDRLVKPTLLYYTDFEILRRPLGPVSHTWSLAVEEQFYLVWPLLLIAGLFALRRWPGRAGLITLTVVLVVMSLLGAWWRLRVGSQPTGFVAATRRPDTNAFSLFAGAALAAACRAGWRPPRWVAWLAWPAMVAMLVLPRINPIRSMLDPVNAVLLLTVLALVAVCGCLVAGSTVFFSWPLRAVGAVSYGLYLWHFPLMTAYAGGFFRPFGTQRAFTSVLISMGALGVAYLSFVLVERPLIRRYRGRLERAHLTSVTMAAAAPTADPPNAGPAPQPPRTPSQPQPRR